MNEQKREQLQDFLDKAEDALMVVTDRVNEGSDSQVHDALVGLLEAVDTLAHEALGEPEESAAANYMTARKRFGKRGFGRAG